MSEGSFKIPKQAVSVRVLMRGAREWTGEIFLNFFSPFHEGAQGLSEFLNEPLPFMPVRFSSGEVRLVGKGEIIAIAASIEALAHHGASTEFAVLQRAEIHMVDSVVLEGDVNLSDASVPSPRLIDVLNNPSAFISLKSGPEFYAVNKNAVRWAVPLEFCGAAHRGESESEEPAHV